MSVRRRDLIRYLEENGFIYYGKAATIPFIRTVKKTIPIKRHRSLDRITANELCKQAGIQPVF